MQNDIATFSTKGVNPQLNPYKSYPFFDQEINKVQYNTGTYYGTKKIFNVGNGIQYQKVTM